MATPTSVGLGIGAATLLGAGLWFSMRPAASAPTTHTYFVAADQVEWDYAPGDTNRVTGKPFGEEEGWWVSPGDVRIGDVYQKALYREYTDSTFTTLKPRPPEWQHLGILGPLLRAQVGDTIRVVYRNNVAFPTSVHPHGVFYDKDSEGSPYDDGTPEADRADDAVPPGGTYVYVWPVPERAGPAEGDPSSIFWMYHSHTNEIGDVNAGLIGPMIIDRRGSLGKDGRPKGIDRELVVAFAEFDENESPYLEENVRRYTRTPDSVQIGRGFFGNRNQGAEGGGNFMESMNGFVYATLPGLTMRVGQRVRWYVMATTNFEIHSPHWHGNVVTIHGMRMDNAALLPMGMLVADMQPDNPGTWFIHCHVGPHLQAGMQAFYHVAPAGTAVAGGS